MVFQIFTPDTKYTLTNLMNDPNFNGCASQWPGSRRCWSPGRMWSCCRPALLPLAASCAPSCAPGCGGLARAPGAPCNPSCCRMLGCGILGASTDTDLARNQWAPHDRSCVLLEYPPSRILRKVLSEIRYNTASHGYSWMFLLISAHLKTEVTKINWLMQTSDDGNTSFGREVAVKCSNALPLIFAAHI